MEGLVIRLAGVEQPETRVLHQKVVTIGTAPTCDLSFRDEGHGLPPSEVLLTLRAEDDKPYRVAELHESAAVIRDGEAVNIGDSIRDGDTFYFGQTGVRLRFFFLSSSFELAESLNLGTAVLARSRAESAAVKQGREARQAAGPRTDVALVFVKQLLRELVAEIPRRVLYAAVGVVALVIGLIVYVNTMNFVEARRNRDAISDLNQSLNNMRKEMTKASEEISKARRDAANASAGLSLAARVVENYGSGVCLVYGLYSYVDPRSGREARYKEVGDTLNLISPNGTVNLSPDGPGPVSDLEFLGTGFHVAPGLILTNSHVVQPWDGDPVASVIRAQGLRPKLKELYAYFPKVAQPFRLTPVELAPVNDVALCSFAVGDTAAEALPVLPLEEEGAGVMSGQPVVLMGYPAGLEGLLAKVDERQQTGLALGRRSSLRAVLNELSGRGLISPLNTQGHIAGLTESRIVHDAATSDGGSGGPIFGAGGKVIGINQAVLDNSPAKFGVPIRYGAELFRKHRPEVSSAQGPPQASESQ
jgi:serine protease Do